MDGSDPSARDPDGWRDREEAVGRYPESLATILEPDGPAAEAYRTLRTNLIYALVDNPPKVVVITSSNPQEGKSTVCANLGVVLAQADRRTLILDCDLRRPSVHGIFGLRNLRGLVDVVAGRHAPNEVWQEPLAKLKVMTSGPIPPNPSELLGSKRFSEFLGRMRQEFDYVLLDAPPVGPVSDPSILATQGDGVLLVLDAQNTRKAALRRSRHDLETVGARVIGAVMNNVRVSSGGHYGYQTYTYEQKK